MLIINKIAEVPKVKNEVESSKATHTLSLREGNEVTDVAIHRVSGDAVDLSVHLLVHSGSPRAFCARDDNIGCSFLTMVSPIKFRLLPNRLVLPLNIKGISDQFMDQVAFEHEFIL